MGIESIEFPLAVDVFAEGINPTTCRDAGITVCDRATDRTDARQLLQALGLKENDQ